MQELDPNKTKRAQAFSLWRSAPMPMVTLFKNLNVTKLVKISRKKKYKFNMLLCWCIGKAAAQTEEFYLLPAEEKMIQYDKLAVSIVVAVKDGRISTCDVPFTEDLEQFSKEYLRLTRQVCATGEPNDLSRDHMVLGTSALAKYDIAGAVNVYAGVYNNPFFLWGKYHKGLIKTTLTVSFQFHHAQMDGVPAAQFLEQLQSEIKKL